MKAKGNTLTEFTNSVRKNFKDIHQACIVGDIAAVEQLLKNREQATLATYRHDVLPIHIAAAIGQLNMVQLLVNAGSPVDVWANAPVSTPLQLACKYGHDDVIRYLLKQGANPDSATANILSYDKEPLLTPLTWCVINAKEDLSIIKMMLEKANPNFHYQPFLNFPIHCAIEQNRKDIFLLLVKHGANLEVRGNDLQTPLKLTLKHKNQELFKLCLILLARLHHPTESIFDRIEQHDFVKYNTAIPGVMLDLNLRLTILVQCAIARQQLVAQYRSDSAVLEDRNNAIKLFKLMLDDLETTRESSLYHLYFYLSSTTQFLGLFGKPKLRELTEYCFDLEVMKAIFEDSLTCRELGLANYLKVLPPQSLQRMPVANYSLADAAGREKFRADLLKQLCHHVYAGFYKYFDEDINSYNY